MSLIPVDENGHHRGRMSKASCRTVYESLGGVHPRVREGGITSGRRRDGEFVGGEVVKHALKGSVRLPIHQIKNILKGEQGCVDVEGANVDAAARMRQCIDDLQAHELLGREIAFRLALATAQGRAIEPEQAAQELAAAERDLAAGQVIASTAYDSFDGLRRQKCECGPFPPKGLICS